jgi:glucose/arabinose dehydrogenase
MNKKIFQKFTTLLTLCLLMISMPLDQLGNKPGYVLAATETPYVRFETVVTGLSQPLFATHAGDGSGRIFIVERGGKIRIYKNGALNALPFLNISSLVTTSGNEQGLLGLAFHPNYGSNRFLYVVYTEDTSSDLILARYRTFLNNPDRVRKRSGKILLRIPEPYANHNGSTLAFGPDGFLYMSTGDGGSHGDPDNNAEDTTSLLGKILRLDVDSSFPYAIPNTNPFYSSTDPQVQKEIWAYGLRNPWRFSFDRLTGDLFIADVGQDKQEEVNFQPAGAAGGSNYGWNTLEGNLCYDPPSGCTPPPDYVPPVAVYNHGTNDSIGCSITGGYIYRGTAYPGLGGYYFFGDYCRGRIWSLNYVGGKWVKQQIAKTDYLISSFGEDEAGEIYMLDYAGGKLLHMVEATIQTRRFRSQPKYDGWVLESGEFSGTGGKKNDLGKILKVGDNISDKQFRTLLSFGTAHLPDNAVITKVTLKVKMASVTGTDPMTTHNSLVVDIKKKYFYTLPLLQVQDFQAVPGKYKVGKFPTTPYSGWYQAVLYKGAFSYINKTGRTQLRLRFLLDDNDDNSADILKLFSGNALKANRPKLIVKYYVP